MILLSLSCSLAFLCFPLFTIIVPFTLLPLRSKNHGAFDFASLPFSLLSVMSSPSSTSSHSRSVRRRILRYLRRSTVSGPLSTPLALITGRNLATTSSRLSAPTSQESPYSRETSSFSVNSSSNSSGRIDEGFHQTQQQKLSSAILSEECVCTAAGNVLLQLAYFSAKCILTAVRERETPILLPC